MFEVQKLFREFIHPELSVDDWLAALKVLGIDVRDYPEHKMWLLDYNQIECVKNHPVVNECRGLIMGYDGKIIRKGFSRFYNLGENGMDTFDFENSTAFEKADGTLVYMYWCEPTGRWEIGTRGTAFAEGPHAFGKTFRDWILAAMGVDEETFQRQASAFDTNVTRLYEYIGSENRIVTPYKKSELVALSYMNHVTGIETVAPPATIERLNYKWNVRLVNQYSFATQADCMKALHDLSGLEEGYVVYNHKTRMRVKIKSPAYVAAHRIRGNGLTPNSICELVAMNEQDEYIAVFPEDEDKFKPALDALAAIRAALNWRWGAAILHMQKFTNEGRDNQKEFALFVKDMPLSSVMFNARRYGTDVQEAFDSFPTTKRAEWIRDQMEGRLYV